MNKNMGKIDILLRLIAAVVIVILLVMKVFTGALSLILGILMAVFLITSAIGFCPLYVPLKITTRKKKE